MATTERGDARVGSLPATPQATERAEQRAKTILVEIVRAAGRSGLKTRGRVHKAFYGAHVFYLERSGRLLSAWPVVRMPHGPGLHRWEYLLLQLEREKAIAVTPGREGPYSTHTFRLGEHHDRYHVEDQEERRAIRDAVDWVKRRTVAQLEAETHEGSRAWQTAAEGEELILALDTMTDEEYAEELERQEEVEREIGPLFR